MRTSFISRALRVLVPATMLLAACGKSDTPAPTPVPDQGRIYLYHGAASANVGLKFLLDDGEKANLTYGQSSNYQSVNTGGHTLKINVASSNATQATQAVTVEKDKNYSYFAYANTATTVGGLLTTDDLATPSSGKAKIRFVHLGQGAATAAKLSTVVAGIADIAGTDAQFGNASGFVEIIPGQYNIAVTSGTPSVIIANVGDGSGSGTGTNKTYEAGKIYTVLLRGVVNPLLPADLQPKAVLIQNN
ncbi:DUF4397 domain-containing protein [Hymenobacter properus]|uniref:DUF4397 domain-containing protein n=1 Tax=Hymenobacter properus TaxID=2791026 RepID=A0A931FHN5_9BACT|nr:DUF4397 domain-containing protein [Hymenobacter properus]MBF9141252.1 DUF4397 domain-containing protein [Hymenobacter properus]MBR7720061.1 DUF4397 domain-containing protein [Microvirga sp. SRT04]